MTIRKRFAALAAVVFVLGACGGDDATAQTGDAGSGDGTGAETTTADQGASFPVTVSADNGEVTIEEEPTAILSLSPSITEMLYAVGAGDQVAAVDTSSNHPEQAPRTEMSGFRPNVEAIGELEPDLVFLARDRDDVVSTLESVGLTVVLLESAEDLDDVSTQIETVGAATGHAEEGRTVAADVEAGVQDALAQLPEDGEQLTYFLELTAEYNTLTSDTFVGSLMSEAGLENIADGVDPEAGSYPQLSAEYLLEADPDVVFIAHADGSVPSEEELAARPGWAELTAVAEGNVVPLDPDIASRWGPRVVDLVESVVEVVQEIEPS